MANKKITELTELTATNIANNDVLAIVDVGGDETKKVSISSLRDIFDDNVSIDTAKIVYGLTGANTNISTLSVNTLPLIGGTVTGPMVTYSINSSSKVSIAQSLAIGYVDHRIPQANLDVKDNVYIGGATTISGTLTLGSALAVGQGGTGATSLTGAELDVIIPPKGGHGKNAVEELGGFYVMLNTSLEGTESGNSGDVTVANDFRKITLIRDPQSGGSAASNNTLRATKAVNLTGVSGTFTVDEEINQATTGAVGKVEELDYVNNILYFKI